MEPELEKIRKHFERALHFAEEFVRLHPEINYSIPVLSYSNRDSEIINYVEARNSNGKFTLYENFSRNWRETKPEELPSLLEEAVKNCTINISSVPDLEMLNYNLRECQLKLSEKARNIYYKRLVEDILKIDKLPER